MAFFKENYKSFIINTTKLSMLISGSHNVVLLQFADNKKQSTFYLKVKFVSVLVKCNENIFKTELYK